MNPKLFESTGRENGYKWWQENNPPKPSRIIHVSTMVVVSDLNFLYPQMDKDGWDKNMYFLHGGGFRIYCNPLCYG